MEYAFYTFHYRGKAPVALAFSLHDGNQARDLGEAFNHWLFVPPTLGDAFNGSRKPARTHKY
ncbi:MAG: hypothetical protein LBR49_01490 [Tannerella sp.]|jgi:hypothetical protein|nr:hypothetical protein [Tannerella sp.]